MAERLRPLDCDLVDAGFISDAEGGAQAAEQLRVAGCDLIVAFLPTYLTSSISSRRPLLRGLGTYHGKRGFGVSVEFDVRHGAVTVFGIAQQRDGSFRFVTSGGTVVDGPLVQIGNTTSRVDFGANPGEWTDAWSATGISHHWALGVGDLRADIAATADLLGIECADIALAN